MARHREIQSLTLAIPARRGPAEARTSTEAPDRAGATSTPPAVPGPVRDAPPSTSACEARPEAHPQAMPAGSWPASPGAAAAAQEPAAADGSEDETFTTTGPAAPRLGEVLCTMVGERRPLGPARLAQIESVARQRGIRFGDAAVALGAATAQEVVGALALQYHYPSAPPARGARQAWHPAVVMLSRPYSPQAEALRALRGQLLRQVLRTADGDAQALAIVSPDSGDGKTFLAANLGVALAQVGGRTLLVDADLLGPRLHAVLGMADGIGLSSVLAGRSDLQCVQAVPSVPGLALLGAGAVPPNPLELFERPAFEALLRHARTRFDHVLVDTPAAVYGSDAQVIADRCGAVLVVARRHASRLASLQTLADRLAEGPARVAGIVFNEFKG